MLWACWNILNNNFLSRPEMTGSKLVPKTFSMPSEVYLVRANLMEPRTIVRGSCLLEMLTGKRWLEALTKHKKLSLAKRGLISVGRITSKF